MNRAFALLAATAALALAAPAHATIVGVVTRSGADLHIGPPMSGAFSESYSGNRLVSNNSYGAGLVSYSSIAQTEPGYIAFSNGNVASGIGVTAESSTQIDVTVTNDGAFAVPFTSLDTVIIPAEMGFFVSSRDAGCTTDITTCPLKTGNFQRGLAGANGFSFGTGDQIASATFDYRVTSGADTLFSLFATTNLANGTGRPPFTNSVNTYTGGAENVLANFRTTGGLTLDAAGHFVVDPADNATLGGRFGYAWDETHVAVAVGGPGYLSPGESRVFTFTTYVSSFSGARPCEGTDPDDNECVGAFSSFGDPIGGTRGPGGSARVLARAASGAAGVGNVSGVPGQGLGLFQLALPTFASDGTLRFDEVTAVATPEPGNFILFGMGLIGVAFFARRSRGPAHRA